MFTGARITPDQLLSQVNAVTAADIQCVPHAPFQTVALCSPPPLPPSPVSRLIFVTPPLRRVAKGLIKSKVALAAVGDVSYVPSYDAIAELFK
jgi:hypothetical protein